jgi:formate-dependent nitrite reductase cytochrome c552 subunit
MPGIPKSADTGDIATHNWKIAMPGKAARGEPSACSACHINPKANAPQMPADVLQKLMDDRQKETADRITALEKRLKALGDKNTAWMDRGTSAPAADAPDDFKATFTNVSFVKADGSKGFHNYQYAKAVLDKAESDLKKLEQLAPTPTTSLPTPTPIPPTRVPEPTTTPTVAIAPQATPGANWIVWIALAIIVVAVVAVLAMRKPKAS